MSRVLICTMLIAVVSSGLSGLQLSEWQLSEWQLSEWQLSGWRPGGPAARTGPLTRTGLVVAGTVSDDAAPSDAGRFGWPLAGSPTVVRAFHPPTFRYGPGHRGVDLGTVAGAPVLAADAGTVAFAGAVAGYGVVSVDHPGGLRTTYEPVSPTVTIGEWVVRGERIGTVQAGHLGCPVAVCLHWGALRGLPQGSPPADRQYLDPLRLLAAARVRLLPIDAPLVTPGASAGGGVEHLAPEP